MTAREQWKQVQAILGTAQDGIPGPNDEAALRELKAKALLDHHLVPASASGWHEGKASSFADPVDIAAFRRCKAQGKSDQECFRVGDNGIGKWGADTTQPLPICALPPEDWKVIQSNGIDPNGALVVVEANSHHLICELRDTMPSKKNITNSAIIDLNPEACKRLGLQPPILVDARWRWA